VRVLGSVDGGLTAVSASADEVRLWDCETGACLAALEAAGVCSLATSARNHIFLGTADGCVNVIEPGGR
jgi:WD40 repeat protein